VSSEVELVGADKAADDLRRWADQLAPFVDKETVSFGATVADSVRGAVPYLTGQLSGSVESGEGDPGVEVSLGGGVEYAAWIEFGGSRGRPFIPEGRYLYPTLLAAEDSYVRAAEQASEESVRRFHWSTPST